MNFREARAMARVGRRRPCLADFRHSEEGALLPFGLMLLVAMLMLGGMALDLMRHEERRVVMQQTLDRSVLAAAALTQDLDPESVVRDYFAKAGMLDDLASVTVEEGLNFRRIDATAYADTDPFFMHMMGVENFYAGAGSTAEQRINNVEISLVLDISGSMSGSRINALRPAAREFIATIISGSEPGRATISLVPYSAQVNLGKPLMDQFNVTDLHSSSYCVELPDSVFSSMALSRTTAFIHNGHFDPFSGRTSGASLFNCTHHAANQVVVLGDNITTLQNRITNLVVGGNTSIDLGVKWGALLLDRSTQPLVADLVTAGAVSATHANRPLDPDTDDTLKVLVVMTDGENTTEYKLASTYRTGNSHVYRRASDGRVWVYHNRASTSYDYYRPDDGNWYNSKASDAVQMTWQDVFARWSVDYVAYNFFGRPLNQDYNTWYNTILDWVSSTKNSRLQQICTTAKDAGVIIFGIAFEAPSDGRTQIRTCASSTAHYYNASTVDITSTFRSIASQISHLRLTQ